MTEVISYREKAQFDTHFVREHSNLLETAVEWITENLSPEQVFEASRLEEWAEENGFVLKNS